MFKLKSYNRTHLRAWAFDLEKHGHISCFIQNCPFIAFDLPEIISHYRTCKGDSVYDFICQFCQKATDKLYKLHNHLLLSHEAEAMSLPYELEYNFKDDGDKIPEETPKVMKDLWRMFLNTKGYIKCLVPVCHYLAKNMDDMENHYLCCTGATVAKEAMNACEVCHGVNPDSSFIVRHRETCHANDTQQPLDINFSSLQLRGVWQKELQDNGMAKCNRVGCEYAALSLKLIREHYTYCRTPAPERYVPCEICDTWWENMKSKADHAREHHQITETTAEPPKVSNPSNALPQRRQIRKPPRNQNQDPVESDPNVASIRVLSEDGLSWQMNVSGLIPQPSQLDLSYDGIAERIFASSLTLLESSYRIRHFYHKDPSKTAGKSDAVQVNSTKANGPSKKGAKMKRVDGKLLKKRGRRPKNGSHSFLSSRPRGRPPRVRQQENSSGVSVPQKRRRGRPPKALPEIRPTSESPPAVEDSSEVTRVSDTIPQPKIRTYSRIVRRRTENIASTAATWPLNISNELNSKSEDEISIRDFQNLSRHTLDSSSGDSEIDDITFTFNEENLLNECGKENVSIQLMESIAHDHPYTQHLNEVSNNLPEPVDKFSLEPKDSLLNSTTSDIHSKLDASPKNEVSGFRERNKGDFRNLNKLFDFEFFSHRVGVSFVVCPLYDTVEKRSEEDSSRQNEETQPGNETEPVKRRGRPRRKVVDESEARAVEELNSSSVNADEENDEEGAESETPTQRRSSRRKRGRASVKLEESEDIGENQDSSLDASVSDQPVTTKRRKALPYDDIRVNYFTKLKNPADQVKCGVCSETMTAREYQSRHLQRHSYICWLEGEPPMDNEDEDVLARYLYRVYIKGKNVIFTCEKCNETKKSAKGFVTHRALCGKSGAEVDQVMAKCGLCGRVVMPYCLESHMMAKHSKRSDDDGEADESQGRKVRLAASKCLKTLSSITSKTEYQSPLRGKQDADTPSYNSENEGDGDGGDDGEAVYSVVKRRTTKILKTLWGTSLKGGQEAKCMVRGCEFSTNRMKTIIRHYQSCTVEPLEYKCRECTFQSFSKEVVLKHVKTNHEDLAEEKRSAVVRFSKNGGSVSGIPFVTQAESRIPSSCSFFYEAVKWTNELRNKFLAFDALYESCDFKSEDWAPLDAAEAKPYLPRQSKSMKFFVGKTVEQKEWNIIQTFEARRGSDDAITTLFCGGPLSSIAWAPIDGPQQYLALSTDLSMDQPRIVKDVSPAPGSVQIWSATRGANASEPQDIKLEYILCHDEGSRAWDMKWCPGGVQNDRRMGMLALATSSGIIPIYSLPWPGLLPDLGRRIKTFKPKAMFGLILDSEKAQCTTVSWSQAKPHRILAAGFTNGIVALWDLTQESQLLRRANNLLPFKVINAHSHIVTSVALSPTNEDNLVTSARDKIIKCWDVKDTTCPQSQNHRGTAVDVDWVYSWMSSALIIDSVSSSFPSTTVLLYPYRYVAHQTNIICGTLIDSTPLGLSVNSWLNAILTSYDNGQVSMVFARNQVGPRDERKKFVKIMIQPELHDFRPSNTDCNTYAKASEKFGVTFFTDTLADHSQRLKKNPPNPINAYPILAANKVAWNPNPASPLNFAVGYQSGFVLITDVLLTQTDQKLFNGAFASLLVKRENDWNKSNE